MKMIQLLAVRDLLLCLTDEGSLYWLNIMDEPHRWGWRHFPAPQGGRDAMDSCAVDSARGDDGPRRV